jgi:hypothetical protein
LSKKIPYPDSGLKKRQDLFLAVKGKAEEEAGGNLMLLAVSGC